LSKTMSKQTYWEKLRLPQWQRKRQDIMTRDNYTCVSCGDNTKTLNVHHKTYRKGADPWDYDDENFVTYCEDCHCNFHAEKDFLMMKVDSPWTLRKLAQVALFCDRRQILFTQLLGAMSRTKRGEELTIAQIEDSLYLADLMMSDCKDYVKQSKKLLKKRKEKGETRE